MRIAPRNLRLKGRDYYKGSAYQGWRTLMNTRNEVVVILSLGEIYEQQRLCLKRPMYRGACLLNDVRQ